MARSPHILVSLFSLVLMVGLAGAMPSIGGPGDSEPGVVPRQLAQSPVVGARVRALLPAGLDIDRAASGFDNLGDFISALHVSDNLDIPFHQLKRRVTGPGGTSLGQAIREFRPSVNPNAEVRRAREQARRDQERGSN